MNTFTNQTKSATTFSNTAKTVTYVDATAGLYYGFGAFTYSGGQHLTAGAGPVFTNATKATSVFTNQNKS